MLANLGYQKLDDIIGRTDLLQPRNVNIQKTKLLDLSFLLKVSSFIALILSHLNTIYDSCWIKSTKKITSFFLLIVLSVGMHVYFREL